MEEQNEYRFENFEYRFINQPIFNNLIIMDFGHETCKPTKSQVGPERRDHISLHYVMKGKGTLTVDQKSFKIGAGQIFITPCNAVCCYYPDKEDAWEYLWITFKGSKCMLLCEMMGLTQDSPVYRPQHAYELFCVFADLVKGGNNYKFAVNFFAFSKLFQIICMINEERRIALDLNADKKETSVQSIIGYIERNYSNTELLSLETIAKWIHLDPIYLNRIFKKTVGCTIHKYIINYKILKAGELIEHSGYSFAEIAQITGWTDYAQFSKSFKKYYGISPTRFKSSQE